MAAIAPTMFAVAMMLHVVVWRRRVAMHAGRDIDPLIPVVLHEIGTLAAGVVARAVLGPVLGVAGRYPKVDRALHDGHRCWGDDHRRKLAAG